MICEMLLSFTAVFFLFESWLLRFNCRVDTNNVEPTLQETWSAGGSKWQQEVTVWHSWRYLRLFRHFSCKPTDMNSIKISALARCYFEPSDWYCSEAPHMSDSVDSSGPPPTVCTAKTRPALTQLAFTGLFFCSFLLHRPFRPPLDSSRPSSIIQTTSTNGYFVVYFIGI